MCVRVFILRRRVMMTRYYPLEISHFKSSLDGQLLEVLWNKYWVHTLSQSPLLTVRKWVVHRQTGIMQTNTLFLVIARIGNTL